VGRFYSQIVSVKGYLNQNRGEMETEAAKQYLDTATECDPTKMSSFWSTVSSTYGTRYSQSLKDVQEDLREKVRQAEVVRANTWESVKQAYIELKQESLRKGRMQSIRKRSFQS